MPEITLTVRHEVGLHARPAAVFVRTAKQFCSAIRVTHGEREANAKSILSVLTLGAEQGAVITLQAEGADADQALAALEVLVRNNFGEVS
jgi:phosphotransferase system HPr (HPr) family protein